MDNGRILIIRFSSLGDVALISPVISLLYKRGFKIHLLTRILPANLYLGDPRVERIWRLEDYKNIIELAKDVKAEVENYDYILDLHLQPRSIILTQILKSISKHGTLSYKKEAIARYILLYTHKKFLPIHHTIYRYLTALPFLGSPETLWDEVIKELTMPFFSEEIEELDEELKSNGKYPDHQIIFLAPGARYQTKRWPLSHFISLAEMVNGEGFSVGIVGGPDDKVLAQEILKRGISGFDYTGTKPRQTILLLKKGEAIVTNDSAHQHFGMLAGIPTLTIFGPTVPEFGFYPLGKKDKIIQKELSCRPCSMHGEKECKRGDHLCMQGIKPEEVFNSLMETLKNEW